MTDDKEKLLRFSRWVDLYERARQYGVPQFSRFLTGEEQVELSDFFKREYHVALTDFVGGYEGAERKLCVFLPEGWDISFADVPISGIRIMGNRFTPLSHRDYLGSLLALGIRREMIGDIVADAANFCADVILDNDIVPFVLSELKTVGRCHVTVRQVALCDIHVVEAAYETHCDTVPSLRADAVLAAVLRVSREKASEMIASGLVACNHAIVTKKDAEWKAGDMLSVKGKGRFLIHEAGGVTKKGRIRLTYYRYV